MFNAVQTVQIANAEERLVDHLRRLNDTRLATTVRDRVFTQVVQSFNRNMQNIATGVILLLAAQSMRSGSFTLGDFALFVYYLSFVSEFTSILTRFLTTYRQIGVSFARMQTLMQGADPERLVQQNPLYLSGPLPDISSPIRAEADQLQDLRIKGLTYRHPDSGQGIANVDLTIERGSLTVITGRIGSGKTTLLRTLLGLLPKQAGETHWNGTRIDEEAEFFLPPRSAYTPQVPQLFSATLLDNVLLGLPGHNLRFETAIHSSVLERDLHDFPNGLDTLVGPRGVRLSGGQVQRTAAARAFVRQPELLVLDDLSSALDVETELLWTASSKSEAPPVWSSPIVMVCSKSRPDHRPQRWQG
jgi:ATP-binding cassette subfamily B protein